VNLGSFETTLSRIHNRLHGSVTTVCHRDLAHGDAAELASQPTFDALGCFESGQSSFEGVGGNCDFEARWGHEFFLWNCLLIASRAFGYLQVWRSLQITDPDSSRLISEARRISKSLAVDGGEYVGC
jgi:hypothetical protein